MRVAVIDVGTNTALLLVAERSTTGELQIFQSERRFVRLGEGLGSSGVIAEAAIRRLEAALVDFKERANGTHVVRVVGTSASRDAANIATVIERVRLATGWQYEVLSGEDEARYSHAGALAAIPHTRFRDRATAVLDIGGGSTEITVAQAGQLEPGFRTSMQFGTVRLMERFVTGQPVTSDEQTNIRRTVRAHLAEADVQFPDDTVLVGAAGTAVTLALLDHRRTGSSARKGESYFLSIDALAGWRERLNAATFDEVVALDPDLMHGRADVIPVGAIIAEEVALYTRVKGILVSPYSLRHGIALHLLSQ